uniref:HIT domain-containing protein n=1 Tax=Chloropicon laureae TaxID=464258 RepID=A0A7S3E3S4_9CHLO
MEAEEGARGGRASPAVASAPEPGQCVFCDIIRNGKTSDGSPILHEDELCIAITDIRPAAAHHILVLPKEHLATTASLEQSHWRLVQHMLKVGMRTMERQKGSDAAPMALCKFGFHQPPFNSVDHLHLHCLCPPYRSILHSLKYKSLPWFISAEALVKKLSMR